MIDEHEFEYRGYTCLVRFNEALGFRCGYVKLHKDEAIDTSELGVHGGVTFTGKLKDKDGGWIGWDYGHYCDGIDVDAWEIYNPPKDEEEKKFRDEYISCMNLEGAVYKIEDVIYDCKRAVDDILKSKGE